MEGVSLSGVGFLSRNTRGDMSQQQILLSDQDNFSVNFVENPQDFVKTFLQV